MDRRALRFRLARRISVLMYVALVASPAETAWGQRAAKQVLSCQPTTLKRDGVLVLKFAIPHPAELAIRDPNGIWFFLVYGGEPAPPAMRPLVDKKVFHSMKELRLPVESAMGSPWAAGHDKNERIFTKAGRYQVVLSDALESDAPGRTTFRCNVRYDP